jgi:hypothetical protein
MSTLDVVMAAYLGSISFAFLGVTFWSSYKTGYPKGIGSTLLISLTWPVVLLAMLFGRLTRRIRRNETT